VQLAPLFDNGTSLGHERFEAKVARWSEADIERYISKGEHHVRWAHGHARDGHIALVKKALLIWPGTKETTAAAIHQIDRSLLEMSLQDLPGLRHPVPLSSWRLSFMLALLGKRLLQLQEIFK
jgi:hypothetical protein